MKEKELSKMSRREKENEVIRQILQHWDIYSSIINYAVEEHIKRWDDEDINEWLKPDMKEV